MFFDSCQLTHKNRPQLLLPITIHIEQSSKLCLKFFYQQSTISLSRRRYSYHIRVHVPAYLHREIEVNRGTVRSWGTLQFVCPTAATIHRIIGASVAPSLLSTFVQYRKLRVSRTNWFLSCCGKKVLCIVVDSDRTRHTLKMKNDAYFTSERNRHLPDPHSWTPAIS
jgi:hypothetical protein